MALLAKRFERSIPKAILVAFVPTFCVVNYGRFLNHFNGEAPSAQWMRPQVCLAEAMPPCRSIEAAVEGSLS